MEQLELLSEHKDAIQPSTNAKDLLDLSDEVLLLVLARVPFDQQTSLNIQLSCHKLYTLMQTKSLHRAIAQSQFPSIGLLFYTENEGLSSLVEAQHIHRRLVTLMENIMKDDRAPISKERPDLFFIVEQGMSLLWRLAKDVNSRQSADVGLVVMDMVDEYKFSLSALLALRYAVMFLYKTIQASYKQSVLKDVGRLPLGAPGSIILDETTDKQLFLSFEAATLLGTCPGLFFNHSAQPYTGTTDLLMRNLFIARQDVTGTFILSLTRPGRWPLPSKEPWTMFSEKIRNKTVAAGTQADPVGKDVGDLDEEELYERIKAGYEEGDLAEYVLNNLRLKDVRRVEK